MKETILVTGCAGFIGMNISKALLESGRQVVGIDSLNDYYSVELKKDRLKNLENPNFKFYHQDLCEQEKLKEVFETENIVQVCHLAAQAGVRYSLINPHAYIKSNVEAFLNLLEILKDGRCRNLVYASSSSVYGANTKSPFSVEDKVDLPISLYAATKRTDELFAYVYNHLFGVKSTGLRFFTVYGPWGRPDMACYKFALLALKGEAIDVYNYGKMRRDFTYIDDIVSGIMAALETPFDYEIFNLGNSQTVELGDFIEQIEKELGLVMNKNMLPMQMGDVMATSADIEKTRKMLGFNPTTSVEAGLSKFFDWFFEYHAEDLKKIGIEKQFGIKLTSRGKES